MFTMINQIFASITVLFAAVEKMAKSINNLATVGEEMSGEFKDTARADRAEKRLQREAEKAKLIKQLAP